MGTEGLDVLQMMSVREIQYDWQPFLMKHLCSYVFIFLIFIIWPHNYLTQLLNNGWSPLTP